jgi:hypothetical protein
MFEAIDAFKIVTTPGTTTLNALARWADTEGEQLANSGVTLDDDAIFAGIRALNFQTGKDAPTHAEGQVFWDSAAKTLAAQLEDTDVTLQIGQETHVRATNKTGATIPNGSVVYVSGAQGQRPTIALAQADAAATSSGTLGLATHDIEANRTGYVTTFGLVRGINTSDFSAGAVVYLSATTAGALTGTEPAAPNRKIRIGCVSYSHETEGALLVRILLGSELGGLHDVDIDSIADGQLIHYVGSNSRYQNTGTTLKESGGKSTFAGATTVEFDGNVQTTAGKTLGVGGDALPYRGASITHAITNSSDAVRGIQAATTSNRTANGTASVQNRLTATANVDAGIVDGGDVAGVTGIGTTRGGGKTENTYGGVFLGTVLESSIVEAECGGVSAQTAVDGTVAEVFGLEVVAVAGENAVITDRYGMLLRAPIDDGSATITNDWAIYSLKDAPSYLAGLLQTDGGRKVKNTRVTTTPYTALATDYNLSVNTDSAAITVNLPAGVAGTMYRIVNTGTSGNAVTLAPNGSENLLGENSSFVLRDGESLMIVYDATDGWY